MILKVDQDFLSKIEVLYNLASTDSTATLDVAKGRMVIAFHQREVQVVDVIKVNTEETFSFSMKMESFYKLLTGYEGHAISTSKMGFALDDNFSHVECVVDPQTVPIHFPSIDKLNMQELPPEVFPMAAHVSYATAAINSTNPAAERVCIILNNNTAVSCAVDGYRAAKAVIPINYTRDATEYRLQPKLVAAIARLVKVEDPPMVKIAKSKNNYLMRVGSVRIVAADTLVSSHSPWDNVNAALDNLRDQNKIRLKMITQQLVQYLRRTRLLMDSQASLRSPVNFVINPKEETVHLSYTTGRGVYTDILDVDCSGPDAGSEQPLKISFNVNYLLDMCSRAKNATIELNLVDGLTPTCIYETIGNAQVSHLVLPVRPDKAEQAVKQAVDAQKQMHTGQPTTEQEKAPPSAIADGVTDPTAPIGSPENRPDPREIFE